MITDFLGYVIQGIAISIGTFAGNWFAQRHLEKKLNNIENIVTKIKNIEVFERKNEGRRKKFKINEKL